MKKVLLVVFGIILCIHRAILQDTQCCHIKPRRYDIIDTGYEKYFHGWVDVQGQGAANDYCRLVGNSPDIWLSCALAGGHGKSEYIYNSVKKGFEIGFEKTWYMKDEDGDGRDDYCRCLQDPEKHEITKVICTRAGIKGFLGSAEEGGSSRTFSPTGPIDCKNRHIRPEFGRNWGV